MKRGVDSRRDQKVPKILGERPYKTGDTPGYGVKDHSCLSPPHFVSQGTADKGEENLEQETQGKGSSDFQTGKSYLPHIKCLIRRKKGIGNEPKRLCTDGPFGVSFQCDESLYQDMISDLVS